MKKRKYISVIWLTYILLNIKGSVFAQTWNLNQCLDFALSTNLQLKELELNVKLSEQDLKFHQNKQLPKLSATLNNGLFSGFQQVFSGDFVGEYKAVQSYNNNLYASASIDVWNKNAQQLKIENKKTGLNTARLDIEQSKLQLQIEIISKYYSVLIAKERKHIAEETYKNSQVQYEKSEKLYNLGYLSIKDLNDAKANLVQDKQNFQVENLNERRIRLELAQFLQIKNKKKFDVNAVLEDDLYKLYDIDKIIESALEKSPKILISEQKINQNENEIKWYKAQYYPKITLSYQIGTSSQYLFNLNNLPMSKQFNNNFFQTLILGIQIPIFSQLSNKIQIQKLKIKQDLQENKIEQEKLSLKDEIENIYFDILAARVNYQIATENEEVTKAAYQFAEKSFEIGKVNLYELNINRNNYLIAQLKVIQTKYEVYFKQSILENYQK